MLCYVMLCYVMLCYVMLCYVMLCYVMLCYVMLCYVMFCRYRHHIHEQSDATFRIKFRKGDENPENDYEFPDDRFVESFHCLPRIFFMF